MAGTMTGMAADQLNSLRRGEIDTLIPARQKHVVTLDARIDRS